MNQPVPGAPGTGRIVLWGTCDMGKPRVRMLRDGLRANGVELIECRADIWSGIDDKSQVKGGLRWLGLLARMLLAYPALVWRYLRLPPHDWVLLGYPSIPDIFVIRLFARLRGARVAMDWFLSAYDTVVLDRRLVGTGHPLALLLRAVEWVACRLADRPFMDTAAHARRMERLFGLRSGTCGRVWVGAEAAFFRPPGPRPAPTPGRPFKVLFYGQFIPLHGVETILGAARRLQGVEVDWLLIGRGQEAGATRDALAKAPLERLEWKEWVEYDELLAYIHDSDVCLGIFGASEKAASVIPNKVFQAVAAGKPVITRDSPGIRELLANDGATCWLVPPADPDALATAVLEAMGTTPAPADGGGRAAPPSRTKIDAIAIGRQCLHQLDLRA